MDNLGANYQPLKVIKDAIENRNMSSKIRIIVFIFIEEFSVIIHIKSFYSYLNIEFRRLRSSVRFKLKNVGLLNLVLNQNRTIHQEIFHCVSKVSNMIKSEFEFSYRTFMIFMLRKNNLRDRSLFAMVSTKINEIPSFKNRLCTENKIESM